MKAAVLFGKGDIRFEERPVPEPAANQVQVKVAKVGVCGSDVHYYKEGRIGDFIVKDPIVLGHEFGGTVSLVGSKVKKVKEGDRVVVEPGFPCGLCDVCLSGNYNVCSKVDFFGTPPIDGAFQEYVVAPERFVFPIPDEMSFEEGAFVEPTAVAVHSVIRGDVGLGDVALVIGAGPIGLLTMQVARSAGAAKVFISDFDSDRLKIAKLLGASETVDAANGTAKQVMHLTGEKGADVVLEAVGKEETLNEAIDAAGPAGRVVAIGLSAEASLRFHFFEFMKKELDILGVWRYRGAYSPAIALLASKRVRVDALITHRFSLDQVDEALLTCSEMRGKPIKVVVSVGD